MDKKWIIFAVLAFVAINIFLLFGVYDPTPITDNKVFGITPGPDGTILFQKILYDRTAPYATVFGTKIGLRIQMAQVKKPDTDFKDIAWAPDGKRFAFFQEDKHNTFLPQRVCVSNIGWPLSKVKCTQIVSDLDYGWQLSMGKKYLAFSTGIHESECGKQAFVWNLDPDSEPIPSENFTSITFSPDGGSALFRNCDDLVLVVVGPNDKNKIPFPIGDAIWSADNNNIYFVLPYPAGFEPGKNNKIGSYNVGTQETSWVNLGETKVSSLAVSPDGRVAFIDNPLIGYSTIKVISTDGKLISVGPQDWFVNSVVWLSNNQVAADVLENNLVNSHIEIYEVP